MKDENGFFAGVVIYFLCSAMKTKNVNSKKTKHFWTFDLK